MRNELIKLAQDSGFMEKQAEFNTNYDVTPTLSETLANDVTPVKWGKSARNAAIGTGIGGGLGHLLDRAAGGGKFQQLRNGHLDRHVGAATGALTGGIIGSVVDHGKRVQSRARILRLLAVLGGTAVGAGALRHFMKSDKK